MQDKNQPQPDFVYDPIKDKSKSKHSPQGSDSIVFEPKSQRGKAHHTQPIKNDPSNTQTHLSTDFSDLQKQPKPRWKKVLKVIGIIALVLGIVAAAVAAYLYFTAGKVSTNPFNLSSKLDGESDGRVNILLLGVGDPGHAGETLADTNIILSINTKTKPYQAALISLPRDLEVDIAGNGEGKINEAHAYGEQQKPPRGIQTSVETVEDTLDIPIHYYVKANFSGLKQAVDAVGGVTINVKEPLYDPEYPCEKNEGRSCGLKIAAGQQTMNGSTALKYARCRKGNCGDDFGRAQRQQEVLDAVREKALSTETLANPAKLNDLIKAASDNIKTDLSLRNIQRLQEISKDLDSAKTVNVVFSLKPNGFLVSSKNSTNLLPADGTFEAIQQFVANVFTLGPIWKEDTKITVLNGTTTVGLGGKFEALLEKDNVPITVASLGNAKTRTVAISEIIDYTGGKKPNSAAYLAKLLGVQVTQPTTPVKNPVVDFEVILGSDFAATTTSSANSTQN